MPALRVQGNIFHQIGSILPRPDIPACFMQIFFHSSEDEDAVALSVSEAITKDLINTIRNEIVSVNPFIRSLSQV